MMFLDWTIILLIPAVLLSVFAQWKVSSTFSTYSSYPAGSGLTGAEAAGLLRMRGYYRRAEAAQADLQARGRL